MHLQFKATENFHAYNDTDGLSLRDGKICEVEEAKGKMLLADYPRNFFQVTVEEIDFEEDTVIPEAAPVVEAAPNKMVTEKKPHGQKRKVGRR